MTRRRWITAALALGAVLATGCDKLGPSRSPFFGVDVTGAKAAEAMKLLGTDAQRVQVLFVTVDPKRDTPELLGQYVPAFDPSFLGYAIAIWRRYSDALARQTFAYSIFYLAVLFAALMIDHYLPLLGA